MGFFFGFRNRSLEFDMFETVDGVLVMLQTRDLLKYAIFSVSCAMFPIQVSHWDIRLILDGNL